VTGFLPVLKPPGMTSHDVVDFVRCQTGEKAGHLGTLDPAAAGLLVVALGPATRLSRYLMTHDKSYRAEITFGLATDTGDAEGQITATGEVAHLTAPEVAAALAALTGELLLPVPVYSAVKDHGRPLHRRMRAGEAPEAPERTMHLSRWELLDFHPGPPARALTDLDCAAGTYVRSLAVALAARLGTQAYLSFLVRTRVGLLRLERALTLEEIAAAGDRNAVRELLLPAVEALGDLPTVTASDEQAARVRHGNSLLLPPLAFPTPPGELACILDARGELLSVARVGVLPEGYELQPETVLE